ncbi:PEP-CTERM sorting domain-containing protein [Accumulibacter sp.]|uniref:PEP-CTERM sorting domain-containing protein n=1 Tax=Accumulibacter sp. TaxID=2053492 RepID=UPI0028C4997C|nr:PEP-CTERM sorting domain-containing protein [Accumulibacter sp.]
MKHIISRTITVLGLLGSSMSASAFTIDGNLSDWGVNPTTWMPFAGIEYTIEDQVGGGAFYLSPGWGGQAYDAEALYAKIQDGQLYIALATGHNPRTPNQPKANSYGAGDFAIDFGKNGSFDLGINILHVDRVTGNGTYQFESFGVEAGVYQNPTWAYGLWDSNGQYTDPQGTAYAPDLSHPTHLTGGTLVGMAQLAYTTSPVKGYGSNPNDDHYFYEMSIPLQLLRDSGWDGNPFDIHWTENCANDSIFVDPPAEVSEPATLGLIGLSLFGLFHGRKRKKAAAG